jgi:mannan endo-1,4-beta-mannosidase
MKSLFTLVFGSVLAVSSAYASVIQKRNSNSWAGSNNYYLHALHPAEQASYISSLKSYGTKVVRLWGENCAFSMPPYSSSSCFFPCPILLSFTS